MKNITSNEHRKRIWWCPIGKLSAIPLHAAGTYGSSTSEHVGRYVVSSYTSTLSALHRLIAGSDAATAASPSSPKMLLVSQSSPEGLPPLPHALAEVTRVQNIVPSETLIDVPDTHNISIDTVLDAVKSAHVLHLACHGQQDQENPLNSGFELQDGRLTLGRLMRVSMPHAQLAYLSACESAAIDEDRPDESLNLAGAMIFMGFKSVIATMW
jgi:CHAT domain-containing protein